MADVFISYSTADQRIADFLHRHLESEGITVFLASASLKPGQQWSQEILAALREATLVLFLASSTACASPWVQQELGAALITRKKLVPIVWDLPPAQLPGWSQQFQALNLAGSTPEQVKAQMSAIAAKIKADKMWALLIGGFALAALFTLGS